MKASKGMKNIFFGLLYQFVVIIFGLITPRLLLVSYGSEVNGLLSSVKQLYAYFVLLEAGVGTATLQALYRTISNKNQKSTNEVMAATNIFYKRTSKYYLGLVLLLSVAYPLVIESEIASINIFLIVLFLGIPGVMSYFIQGKYNILLQAEGKYYVTANLSMITYVLSNLIKLLLINWGYGVVFVQLIYCVLNLFPVIYIKLYMKKHYQWLDLSLTPDFKSIGQRASVMVHQVSSLVFSNTDVLILTIFAGLSTVSVYSVYSSFYTMVKSVLFSFLNGLKFKLGQAYHISLEEYIKLHDLFEVWYMMLTFILYTIVQVFIIPFLALYTEGIEDINYIDAKLSFLFTTVFLLQAGRSSSSLVIDFAEHFKKTKNRAILEMTINITVTLICVVKFGIYGVLFGTIVALLYRTNDMIIYANRVILKRSPAVTYQRWLTNLAVAIVVIVYFEYHPLVISSYVELFLYAIVYSVIISAVFFIVIIPIEKKINGTKLNLKKIM